VPPSNQIAASGRNGRNAEHLCIETNEVFKSEISQRLNWPIVNSRRGKERGESASLIAREHYSRLKFFPVLPMW